MNNPDGCSPCECNPLGSDNPFCDLYTGKCKCKPNVEGLKCDQCKNNFYNFSAGCEPCGCDSLGSLGSLCDKVSNQCQCKPSVTGLRCDTCKDGFYGLGSDGLNGCSSCGCNEAGKRNIDFVIMK